MHKDHIKYAKTDSELRKYEGMFYVPHENVMEMINNQEFKLENLDEKKTLQLLRGEIAANRDELRWLIYRGFDISKVNISKITDMSHMFNGLEDVLVSIENWDVSNVKSFKSMFFDAISFDQNLSKWNTSNCTDFSLMFAYCVSFNSPLNNWDVSNGRSFSGMFMAVKEFNQPLDNWNMSKAVNLSHMFQCTDKFNQNINSWDISSCENIKEIFSNASAFNQPLNDWNTENITDTMSSFSRADNFNQPLNKWNMSNVRNSSNMFSLAKSFNQDLSNWDMSNCRNISCMFLNCKSLNQDFSSWNIRSDVECFYAFYNTNVIVEMETLDQYIYAGLKQFVCKNFLEYVDNKKESEILISINKVEKLSNIDPEILKLNYLDSGLFNKKVFNSEKLFLYSVSLGLSKTISTYLSSKFWYLLNEDNMCFNIPKDALDDLTAMEVSNGG